jgi:hypothetical protein
MTGFQNDFLRNNHGDENRRVVTDYQRVYESELENIKTESDLNSQKMKVQIERLQENILNQKNENSTLLKKLQNFNSHT